MLVDFLNFQFNVYDFKLKYGEAKLFKIVWKCGDLGKMSYLMLKIKFKTNELPMVPINVLG